MLFCKLLAGIFLVGGVVQASYCFDIQSLIINNTKETKDVEEQTLSKNLPTEQSPNPQTITKFITDTESKIQESETAITTQSDKADKTWEALKTELGLQNDDKKGIEGIKEMIVKEQIELKAIKAEIKKSSIATKKQNKDLKEAKKKVDDSESWSFNNFLDKANIKLIEGKIKLEKAYSTSKTEKNDKLTKQLKTKEDALKDQLTLKEKQDAKNALIAEIQLREESYE